MSWLDPRQWLLLIAFCAASVVGYHFWSARLVQQGYDAGYAKARAECVEANAAAQAKARKESERLQKEKDDALRLAADRAQVLAADSRRARAELDGLRGDLATARDRLRDAPVDAVRRYAAATAEVFEACAREYVDLAQEADGHASDSLMYQQAWPRSTGP